MKLKLTETCRRDLLASLLVGAAALTLAGGSAWADNTATAPAAAPGKAEPKPAGATPTPPVPTNQPAAPDPVRLAGAYQSGYLSVVAASCFQLYSSMGIIATDLSTGHITGQTALNALDQNALLLGACAGSLEDIRALTPTDDNQGHALLGRLDAMLTALGALDSALVDAATPPPGDAKAQAAAVSAVNTARQQVEAALEAYGKPL